MTGAGFSSAPENQFSAGNASALAGMTGAPGGAANSLYDCLGAA